MERSIREGRIQGSPIFAIAVYFVLVLGTFLIAAHFTPGMRRFLLPAGSPVAGTVVGTSTGFWDRAINTGVVGALSLLGALIFAIPVARIYAITMRKHGYDGSFLRLLVALPLVVAGVVQVVRGDLALAFALAGVVAAVRFRTTVKDLQDATFAFVAIGIGLAAGTGSFVLAAVLSSVFTTLIWWVYRFRLGEVEPSLELEHGGVRLSEALVPGEEQPGVVIGDDDVVEPVTRSDVGNLSSSIERLADFVRADALRRRKKYGSLLLAYVDRGKDARKRIESVLDDHASRWVHVDNIELNHGSTVDVAEYLVRLKKDVEVGTMFDKFGAGVDHDVRAVEIKPIRGFRKRIT